MLASNKSTRTMHLSEIDDGNFHEWLSMGLALWPHMEKRELEEEFRSELRSSRYKTYLSRNNNGVYTGFINLSLRIDYVEGSSSSPVGYVEGIYVKPEYRNQGIAKALIRQAELWAKDRGCRELGSDTEQVNTDSQAFHRKAGFEVADTIVHFIKKLD